MSVTAWVSIWREMEDIAYLMLKISCILLLSLTVKILNWVWWKPMKLERQLREQGFKGPPYRLWYGNLKENYRLIGEACSKPMMNLNHQILQRIDPLLIKIIKEYGKYHTPLYKFVLDLLLLIIWLVIDFSVLVLIFFFFVYCWFYKIFLLCLFSCHFTFKSGCLL